MAYALLSPFIKISAGPSSNQVAAGCQCQEEKTATMHGHGALVETPPLQMVGAAAGQKSRWNLAMGSDEKSVESRNSVKLFWMGFVKHVFCGPF